MCYPAPLRQTDWPPKLGPSNSHIVERSIHMGPKCVSLALRGRSRFYFLGLLYFSLLRLDGFHLEAEFAYESLAQGPTQSASSPAKAKPPDDCSELLRSETGTRSYVLSHRVLQSQNPSGGSSETHTGETAARSPGSEHICGFAEECDSQECRTAPLSLRPVRSNGQKSIARPVTPHGRQASSLGIAGALVVVKTGEWQYPPTFRQRHRRAGLPPAE